MLHDLKNLNCPQPNSHSLLTTEATLHSQNNSNMICHTVKKRHFPFWLIWTIWTKSNLAKLMDLFCLSSFNDYDSAVVRPSLRSSSQRLLLRRGLVACVCVSCFCRLFPLVTIKSVETVIKVLQHILMPRLGPHPSRAGTPDHITTLRWTKLGEENFVHCNKTMWSVMEASLCSRSGLGWGSLCQCLLVISSYVSDSWS